MWAQRSRRVRACADPTRPSPASMLSCRLSQAGFPSRSFFRSILNMFDLGIPPQFFDAVVLPRFFMKYVHDDVDIIEQHPLTVRKSFPVPRADPQFLRAFRDGIGNGADLHIRIGGADDEEICDVGDLPQ